MDSFSDSFLWGATLHGHCVEGGHFDSDWWRWEQRRGNVADGSNSQYGVNHWDLFSDDVKLAGEFGVNSLLIGLEWSRIQPNQDGFAPEILTHYRGVFEACIDRGITPICVLQHVTLPQWIAARGGWLNRNSPEWFREYARVVAEALGEFCEYWIPLHEGMHGLVKGYQQGHWPPEKHSVNGLNCAMRNQLKAHEFAYPRIKECRADAQVGWSVRAACYVPGNPYSAWDARVALREGYRNNRLMLDRLTGDDGSSCVDFIGVSYFGRLVVSARWRSPLTSFVRYGTKKCFDVKYDSELDGFGELLDMYASYKLPILVTGNGCADEADEVQCGYLLDHVGAVRDALNRGASIRGYVWHSLLNGFEWDHGFSRRYGLMVVDRDRMTRSPNSIALLYKELCKTGAVRPGTISQFCPVRITKSEEVVS